MVDDRDAARIQREREARRAIERLRMEEERRDRQAELARLSGRGEEAGLSATPPGGARHPTPLVPEGGARGDPRSPTSDRAPERSPSSPDPSRRPRAIGAAIRTSEVESFLGLDAFESFDLVAINAARFPIIDEGTRESPEVAAAVAERAEAIMARVRREEDDPLSVGAFLRDRVLEWYAGSGVDPGWAATAPRRWGGLFAESRAAGGHRVPWLNVRLHALWQPASKGRKLGSRLRTRFSRDRAGLSVLARTASQQINAEVAQAILDDLAALPRDPRGATPLVRLSELAVRRQVVTVNDSLAAIFGGHETGPFVILHPNRYPDCEEMLIRPPGPGASGAALAYSLAAGRAVRKGAGRPAGTMGSGGEDGPRSESMRVVEAGESEVDADTVWEALSVTKENWVQIVAEKRRERGRLDQPPKDYRVRAAYEPLRDLALGDPEFRKSFLAAKWRGRPAGFPLLVTLLQKGSLAPEVATDHEYLEAELGELAQGDPQWRPSDGVWSLPGWKVVREGDRPGDYRYRAEAI
jgi:hypothetical protein